MVVRGRDNHSASFPAFPATLSTIPPSCLISLGSTASTYKIRSISLMVSFSTHWSLIFNQHNCIRKLGPARSTVYTKHYKVLCKPYCELGPIYEYSYRPCLLLTVLSKVSETTAFEISICARRTMSDSDSDRNVGSESEHINTDNTDRDEIKGSYSNSSSTGSSSSSDTSP